VLRGEGEAASASIAGMIQPAESPITISNRRLKLANNNSGCLLSIDFFCIENPPPIRALLTSTPMTKRWLLRCFTLEEGKAKDVLLALEATLPSVFPSAIAR
jgi:hypothetical protein